MPDSLHNLPIGDDSQRLEQLVAWLDSELDEEQSHEVELRLRRDSGMRQEAEELERVWGLLDTLEPVSADNQFTVQTIQSVFEKSHGGPVRRGAGFGGGPGAVVRQRRPEGELHDGRGGRRDVVRPAAAEERVRPRLPHGRLRRVVVRRRR